MNFGYTVAADMITLENVYNNMFQDLFKLIYRAAWDKDHEKIPFLFAIVNIQIIVCS
ncbi:MAG: hypothetical protein WAM14_20760 [Candidatus Nitrosopolaris sp.]